MSASIQGLQVVNSPANRAPPQISHAPIKLFPSATALIVAFQRIRLSTLSKILIRFVSFYVPTRGAENPVSLPTLHPWEVRLASFFFRWARHIILDRHHQGR